MNEQTEVKVDVLSFSKLFEQSDLPIGVDTYQRGFVWDTEKIEQLKSDLLEYQQLEQPQPPYYMGTILIHRDRESDTRFIIDGQQRLTALSVLHNQICEGLPSNFAFTYSPKSAQVIRQADQIFKRSATNPNSDIFEQVLFTVIEVERVDLAFTFFDTQNNRGVPLHATDLLKAYHLRAVSGDSKERLQTVCAKGWESIQQGASVMAHEEDFAPSLFSKFLWRSRCWVGTQVDPVGHDELMEAFQKQTWKVEGASNTIPLYRSRQNRLGTSLILKHGGQREIQTHPITLSEQAADLPFAIRQPVHKGIGFFLYAEKYASLLQWMILHETDSKDLIAFRRLYNELVMVNSVYLREIFLLSSLMYADQFGDHKLWEFGLWMEHALGSIRLDKQQVRYEAAKNFFGRDRLNLLDVIAGSYLADEVLQYLQKNHRSDNIYSEEQIIAGKGVQGRYKAAALNYFGRDDSDHLQGKASWITQKVEKKAL